jgi:hypothetical protein
MSRSLKVRGAREELKAYGYAEGEGGIYYRPSSPNTEAWKETEDGWICFAPATAAMGQVEGAPAPAGPWGRAHDVLPGWVQVPYQLGEGFRVERTPEGEFVGGVSGLHPAKHPDCFDWFYPDEVVAERYAVANAAAAGKRVKRVENEDGSFSYEDDPED